MEPRVNKLRNIRSHVVHRCSPFKRQTQCGRLADAEHFEYLAEGCSTLNARCRRCFKGEVITSVDGLVEALDQSRAKRQRAKWPHMHGQKKMLKATCWREFAILACGARQTCCCDFSLFFNCVASDIENQLASSPVVFVRVSFFLSHAKLYMWACVNRECPMLKATQGLTAERCLNCGMGMELEASPINLLNAVRSWVQLSMIECNRATLWAQRSRLVFELVLETNGWVETIDARVLNSITSTILSRW